MHKAKIDEIEATYLYLQDQHCQNSQEKSCNTNPSECIVNHNVVLLSDAIRKREGKEPDYEMVCTNNVTVITSQLISIIQEPSCNYLPVN